MSDQIKKSPPVRMLKPVEEHLYRFPGFGAVPTDGVQYTGVATFGTTAVNIVDELIDFGDILQLRQIEVGLTQRFTELKDAVGSLTYNWQMRSEGNFLGTSGSGVATLMDWVNFTNDYTKGIGSLANSEDTFSGYVAIGSVPRAPVRVQLVATGLAGDSMTGEVKSSSYIKLVGTIIPGV